MLKYCVMSQTLLCPECGTSNDENASYCINCGNQLKQSLSLTDILSHPPFGFLLIAVIFASLLNIGSGFVIWTLTYFTLDGFLIYGIISAVLGGTFLVYLAYCIFSRTYLMSKVKFKSNYESYKEVLEKNLEILFEAKIYDEGPIKKLLITLIVILLLTFVGSIIAGVIVFFVFLRDYYYW